MSLEIQTILHGILGTAFLLLFAAAAEMLWDLTPARLGRLKAVVALMVASVVAHDILGSWVYQFYRADNPRSPRSLILASDLQWLHKVLMEYKEFVGGFVPILTIAALYAIFYYGERLVPRRDVRMAILVLLTFAFVFALIAFAFGAMIAKYAPLGGGSLG